MSKMNGNIPMKLLGLLLIVAFVLAGCKQATPTEEPPAAEPTTPPTEVSPTEEVVEEPTTEPTEEVVEPVVVKYTYLVYSVSQDTDLVEEAVNGMLAEKAPGIMVDLNPISQGEYADKTSLMFSAGEECDVVYLPKWLAGIYNLRVANGDVLPLNDLLELTPTLTEVIPELAWTGTMVGDVIYAAPGNQANTALSGINIMEPFLDKYPLDWDSIEAVEDIEPWLDEVLANEPDVIAFAYLDNWFRPDIDGYDSIDTGLGGTLFSTPGILGVKYDDPGREVVNLLASESFRNFAERARRWHEKGYIAPEADPEVFVNLINAKYFGQLNYAQPHDWWAVNYGIPALFGKSLAPLFYANFRVGQNSTGICATTQHPEESIKFLEVLNTDEEVFNTLLYGIEGTHWDWVDEASKLIARPEGWDDYTGYAAVDWALGNQFMAYYKVPRWAENDIWKMEQDLNDAAAPSVMLGFSFDRTPVETEIAQVSAVLDEFGGPIVYGWEEDWQTALDDLLAMLDDAGLGTIKEEMQRQVDAWVATQ
jgi:putative aldouronate transport system substrate-binding protein